MSLMWSECICAGGAYTFLAFWTIVLWTGYAIVWGFAEGSNKMSVDAEVNVDGVHCIGK